MTKVSWEFLVTKTLREERGCLEIYGGYKRARMLLFVQDQDHLGLENEMPIQYFHRCVKARASWNCI